MYKVELTEKEIREVGMGRYVTRAVFMVKMVTFLVGAFAVFVGTFFYWDYPLGKAAVIIGGAVWVVILFLQSRQESKAGQEFLEEIKRGEGEA